MEILELKNCSESKSCDAQKGINSNAFGFDICYCKGGAKRGVDGVCPADPEDAQGDYVKQCFYHN